MSEEQDGWDIMIQCTDCGFRTRRHRNDYPGYLGSHPKATVVTDCSNCDAEAGYPPGGFKTTHFIDYITDAERLERAAE